MILVQISKAKKSKWFYTVDEVINFVLETNNDLSIEDERSIIDFESYISSWNITDDYNNCVKGDIIQNFGFVVMNFLKSEEI